MKDHSGFWLVIGIGALFGAVSEIARRICLHKYWVRSCTGPEWKKLFPDRSKEQIRSFLAVFVDEFGFSRRKRLKFSPNDKVMDVYRALYPPGSVDDSMELASFLLRLQDVYGDEVADAFTPDSTLGDIFEVTTKGNPNQAVEATS